MVSRQWMLITSTICSLLNCATAGSISLFSLFAPALMQKLSYNATQVNCLIVCGQLGLYGTAFFWGSLCDKSPRFVSLCSGVLFALGYLLLAFTYRGVLPNVSFLLTGFYYVFIGMGTCASYMAGVTTNARNFTKHIGKIMGITLATFGISGFLLAQTTQFFHDSNSNLDVERFFYFLSVLLFVVGILGYYGLPDIPNEETADDVSDICESEPLIGFRPTKEQSPFFTDASTYVFALVLLLLTGVGEMVINSFGSMLYALVRSPSANLQSYHMSLISLASCVSRLISGFLSDGMAQYISHPRLALLFASGVVLTMSQAWVWLFLESGNNGIDHFWILSIGSGVGYGSIFSLAPQIVSKAWSGNFGLHWGFLSLAPAVGSCLVNLLYSLTYDRHRQAQQKVDQTVGFPQDALCHGVECFKDTFSVTTVIAGIGSLGVIVLGMVWSRRGRRI